MTKKTSRIQSLVNRADACGMGGNKKAGLVPSNEWNGVTSRHIQMKAPHRLPDFVRLCCPDTPHVTYKPQIVR
jgi:hypothetical protein